MTQHTAEHEPTNAPHDAAPVARAVATRARTEPAIRVENVGKCYRVYDAPADRLKQAVLRRWKTYGRDFWAVRGVSFEIPAGQTVGIIGRNGSGKSTMLQVIAGILTPTTGSVSVRGVLSALLELGAGFNPEFTGRENVYMAGAIMGLSRARVDALFPSIAAFADIGEFLEQPLKTYSSGMAARLAFAVAFSVDPDVMIVDEILAVGDIGFQQKCLSRLRRLRDQGMTLLFVSHSPDSVRSVCQRALFLEKGHARFYGDAERATDQYLAFVREQANLDALAGAGALGGHVPFERHVPGNTRYGTGHVQVERVELLNARGEPCRAFSLGDTITLEATVKAHVDVDNVSVSFLVRDMTGVDLMGTATCDERSTPPPLKKGQSARVRFSFENNLRSGNFGVSLAVHRVTARDYSDNVLFDQVDGAVAFVVVGRPDRPVHYKFHQAVDVRWDAPAGAPIAGAMSRVDQVGSA